MPAPLVAFGAAGVKTPGGTETARWPAQRKGLLAARYHPKLLF
jgi:hypothetical protein